MRKFFTFIGAFFFAMFVIGLLMSFVGVFSVFRPGDEKVSKSSILVMDLEGVILDAKEFLDKLSKYRDEKDIKGVLVRINSPGGAVGPSQEIFAELKRTRVEFKKPVVAVATSMAASGAYYAAVGADKIVVSPGSIVGSIGVIMQFANLERLYDWARIQRYTIKTGALKDAGADYRGMTESEKQYFQTMLNEVLGQFKAAIVEGRKLKADVVDTNADGRIFTGDAAVKMGFADQVGTFEEARKLIGEMTGLGAKPELFKPRKRGSFEWLEMIEESESDSESSIKQIANQLSELFNTQFRGQLLLIWPPALGSK